MATTDPTFRNYTSTQAKSYSTNRDYVYPAKVFEIILEYHKANGGETNLAADLGCGPGNATKSLAAYFDRVVGIDPGVEMINTARETLPEELKGKVSFEACPAEGIAEGAGLEPGSVDLITAAAAARNFPIHVLESTLTDHLKIHWFDHPKFYEAAAKVLKPGGTIACWIGGQVRAHSSTPHATEINEIIDSLYQELRKYKVAGNLLAEDFYEHLPLPWTIDPINPDFAPSSFKRTVYSSQHDNGIWEVKNAPLDLGAKTYLSSSPYQRWSEANPELAGTEKDIVKEAFGKIKEILETSVLDMDVSIGLVLLQRTK